MSIFRTALGTVEAHPYITAGAVFGIGAVIVIARSGSSSSGSSSTASASDPTATAQAISAADALQTTQLQYQAALSTAAMQTSVAENTTAAQKDVAETQANDALAVATNTNAAQISLAQVAAGVSNNQTSAQLAAVQDQVDAQQKEIAVQANSTDFATAEQAFEDAYGGYISSVNETNQDQLLMAALTGKAQGLAGSGNMPTALAFTG